MAPWGAPDQSRHIIDLPHCYGRVECSPSGAQLTRAQLRSPSHGPQHHPGGHTACSVWWSEFASWSRARMRAIILLNTENRSHTEMTVWKRSRGARRASAGWPCATTCPTRAARPQGGGLLCCTCMRQHVQVHRIDRLVDGGHAPAAACSARENVSECGAVTPRWHGARHAPLILNMSMPGRSSTHLRCS